MERKARKKIQILTGQKPTKFAGSVERLEIEEKEWEWAGSLQILS